MKLNNSTGNDETLNYLQTNEQCIFIIFAHYSKLEFQRTHPMHTEHAF